jgi:hypothetical protein
MFTTPYQFLFQQNCLRHYIKNNILLYYIIYYKSQCYSYNIAPIIVISIMINTLIAINLIDTPNSNTKVKYMAAAKGTKIKVKYVIISII